MESSSPRCFLGRRREEADQQGISRSAIGSPCSTSGSHGRARGTAGPPPIGRLKSEHWAQDRNRAVPLTYMVGEGISGIAERDAEPPHLTGCPSR